MKKMILVLVLAFMAFVANAAKFTFDAGYGMIITTEETVLNENQLKEIKEYGKKSKYSDNVYSVHYWNTEFNEEYNYIVELNDSESKLVRAENDR